MDNHNNIALAGGHRNGNRINGRRTLSYTVIPTIILFSLLPGCSPRIVERIVTITQTEVRDSTAWRDTTIYVPIPLESDQAIVHVGDTSHRETSIAESDAWIGKDGMLHHSLRNKTGARIPYDLKMPEHWLYTGVTNTREHEQGIIKKEYVEKPLSWWQKTRLQAFWWLLGGLVLSLAWIFRKPILAILKTVLKL